ncbi:hypothetical protein NDU88_003643 [Pleurodeles waltl]|uniref:BHLH domain-containing protein n=1 Tax=Pleurodeles waltl TaxID=8319 RepID=A0AAV7TRU9_PLEWA|nr:hypothetical protein NDU88_003643 [Pleurodeles waltl]
MFSFGKVCCHCFPIMPGCTLQTSQSLRCRRPGPPGPPACSRRNERERQRVRLVNLGFQALRQHVPLCCGTGSPRRLSKVQTLRAALSYIRGLQELLRAAESSRESGVEEGESSPDPGVEEQDGAESEGSWFYD